MAQNKIMEQMTSLTSMCEMACQIIQKKQEEKRIEEDQATNARYWEIPACCDDDDDYNSAITPNEPVDSLSMGDERLNIISATESDEFIKSCVKNLVPNPSESEGENGCDVPACFTTFSNILFDADHNFYSVDDQSLFNEDISKKIFSNPLSEEEIIPMKIDPHHFNAESDLIESLRIHDSSIIPSSSKIDSLLDEFAGELTLLKSIPPGIDKTDCYHENEIRLTKRLLYENSSPRPPEEFVSENSNAEIESFSPSPILDEDSDSQLLNNYSPSLPVNKSFHFDIPSFSRPSAKPLDGKSGIFNIKMMGDISKQKVCGNGAYVGYNCPAQVPSVQTLPSFPQQYPCCEDSGVTHEPYQCQPKNHDYYNEQDSCFDSNSFGFDQSQPQQYTVNHPIFNASNDYLDSQIQLNSTLAKITEQMTSITSLCEMACQVVQKKLEEKQIEEERAAKAKYWKLPVCYDDDDDEERSDSLDDNIISGLPLFSAITPDEPILSTEDPDNSLSMGDGHLDTIPVTKSDEVIKSRVEDLIPIPCESEGIPEHMCNVPSHDNSPPLDVSKDQFEDFSESNEEFSSIDDDSFSIDDIDYVDASNPDSKLVSSEVMEIVTPKVGGIEASNDNPIPFYDPIIFGTPPNLTPSGESDFFLETKSSSTSLNSLLEETNNFDNSLPEFTTFSKSSVENLIPIPSESEGIPDHMCDVPSHENSPPLDVSKDQFEDFSESNKEFSSTDDDSFSLDNIDYVEASPPDYELVSSEVMEIVISKVRGIKASNDNRIPFYDPIISGTPLNLTPSGERDFFLEGDMLLFEAFLNVDHSSDFKTKSSFTSLNSLLEETNNFNNSLPEFTTFLKVLFDAEYEFDSSDDQSCFEEDVLEKIVSKPLCEEEILPMKSLRTHDSSLSISSKIDSLLDEFAGELTLLKSISLGIDETDCDFKEEIRLIEKLLYDNSSPRPPKEFVSTNSDAASESFSPSPILVKDGDSLMEEIDLFCTPDYPMPPGIEEKDYDSEKDILIPKDLPRNNSLSFAEKESFHFDIPSFSRPPTKLPDDDTGILNIKMMGIVDKDYDSERDILIRKDLPRNNTLSFAKKESFHFDIPPFSRPPAKPPDGDT
nr:hypothetical protein [Tanacetum cinerariifolium]